MTEKRNRKAESYPVAGNGMSIDRAAKIKKTDSEVFDLSLQGRKLLPIFAPVFST